MQRKPRIIITIFLFFCLIVAFMVFARSFTTKVHGLNFWSTRPTEKSFPLQPLLFSSCLSDNGKLHNYYMSQILLKATQQANFSILKTEPHSQCSAQFALINFAAYDLPAKIIKTALHAYHHARILGYDRKQLLTIVDYVKPSNENRLWVFDLNTDKLLFHTLVSHGAASGRRYARHFSNLINSHESSIGVILTGKRYPGIDGYSLRLHGLETGFNNNMFVRDIVMHPAKYVSRAFAKKYDEVGKSDGCFAISRSVAHRLINTIKNGTIVVSYFPNKSWLLHSNFLH